MRKFYAIAGAATLAMATAACSGGAESADEPEAAAETEEVVEEAVADEAPAEEAMEEAADETAEATDAAAGPATATADGIAYASLTGDAAAGKRVFAQCMSCHGVEPGVNKTGPSLAGIVGRTAGSVEGYNYSPANANSGVTWTEENMYVYLEDPRGYIPNTKMIFPGLKKAQDRADVIAFLKDPT
ncbi:c-type cytochrome [Qipengyuania sp. DGS5-3]|uniref:c-type cytochrome n=1 Tax=Qipengyuania sp. DGS5-3 TaxID=3349632 RepID=UPI0036D28BA7